MPFTVSHIAAVIPLNKKLPQYNALSALIIGSMTPDIAYLTPFLVDQRMDSHSLIGVYLFCLPMGLTVYFLYHLLMAPVMTTLLPEALRTRLSPQLLTGQLPTTSSFVLVISLIIGALTHVIWDFFTHQPGLASFWPWMNTPLTRIDGYDILPYRLLQHSSTVVGLGLLFVWVKRWFNSRTVNPKSLTVWKASKLLKTITLLLLLLLPFIAGVYYGLLHLPKTNVLYGLYSAQVFIRYFIVGGAAMFLITSITLGVYYRLTMTNEQA